MKLLNINLRRAASLAFAACTVIASAQIEETEVVEAVADSSGVSVTGFNALDYVLQKPNRNVTFGSKKFGDRLFVSFEAGPAWFHNPEQLFDFPKTDPTFGISVGDWVTPTHGWRASLNGGFRHLDGGHHPIYGGISVDYLGNLSALVRGYDPSRRWEFIGSAGLEYQLLHHCGDNSSLFGLRLGLQARLNLNKSSFVYVEPRVGLYAGDAIDHTWNYRYRIQPSIMFGFGYRRLSGAERRAASDKFVSRGFEENMFYELGGGWTDLKRHDGKAGLFTDQNISAMFSAGKWFNPTSALRLTGAYGKLNYRQAFIRADLDYVWNITSALTGYRLSEVFDLDFSAGLSGIYVNKAKMKFYPGAKVGLQATFNVTHNWGIFIRPELHMYGRHFTDDIVDREAMSSLHLGVRYTVGDYKYDYESNLATFREKESKKNFVTATVGPAKYNNGSYGIGCALQLGYGRWFTPMSAWRVTLDAQTFPRSEYELRNVSLGADYILSLSSALLGYDPSRFFDFSGSVGAYGGLAHCVRTSESKAMRPLLTFKASFLWSFRITDDLRAVVETQSLASNLPLPNGNYQMRPEMRLMLGAHYSF